MARQGEGQKATIQKVMHAFKEGDLRSASGRKVTSRAQAVAIGLNEAGASNRQGSGDGRRRTKADLYAEARKRDIPGRSRMNRQELERALAR